MIHVLHNGELLEQREYSSFQEAPTVGQTYLFNNQEYDVDAIIVDTRKGYCELIVTQHETNRPYVIHPQKVCSAK